MVPTITELRQFAQEVEYAYVLGKPLAPGLLTLARGYLRDVAAPDAVVMRATADDATQQVASPRCVVDVGVDMRPRPVTSDRPQPAVGEVDVPQAHLVPTVASVLPACHVAPHTPLRPFVAHVADDQEEDPNVPAEIDDGSMTTPVPVDVSPFGDRINHRLKPTVCLPITAAPSGPFPGRR
jgi:hypothetical protein